ncbi:hypothetical protein I4F81_012921 [Pyropia yezoensis]|uniref:Uncharacterized protein n=1 Tax=Pyropia yezoensis TaxID=2788 RepID=A0ABQ9T9T2_PYRYE|nr:hypothetical protein I4F81_012921 [Neopyropia yezoensis]
MPEDWRPVAVTLGELRLAAGSEPARRLPTCCVVAAAAPDSDGANAGADSSAAFRPPSTVKAVSPSLTFRSTRGTVPASPLHAGGRYRTNRQRTQTLHRPLAGARQLRFRTAKPEPAAAPARAPLDSATEPCPRTPPAAAAAAAGCCCCLLPSDVSLADELGQILDGRARVQMLKQSVSTCRSCSSARQLRLTTASLTRSESHTAAPLTGLPHEWYRSHSKWRAANASRSRGRASAAYAHERALQTRYGATIASTVAKPASRASASHPLITERTTSRIIAAADSTCSDATACALTAVGVLRASGRDLVDPEGSPRDDAATTNRVSDSQRTISNDVAPVVAKRTASSLQEWAGRGCSARRVVPATPPPMTTAMKMSSGMRTAGTTSARSASADRTTGAAKGTPAASPDDRTTDAAQPPPPRRQFRCDETTLHNSCKRRCCPVTARTTCHALTSRGCCRCCTRTLVTTCSAAPPALSDTSGEGVNAKTTWLPGVPADGHWRQQKA